MTAIWDKLSFISNVDDHEFNQDKINRLRSVMDAIYNVIKDRPEYQNETVRLYLSDGKEVHKLVELLKEILKVVTWTKKECNINYEIVQVLHEFDHKDVPLDGKRTMGHHTEQLFMKRINKPFLNAIKNIHYDVWWNTGSDY